MQFQKYMFFVEYALICLFFSRNLASAKALVGHNVRPVRPNEFPFIAGIKRRVRNFDTEQHTICTASIITNQHVLTAEHCLVDEELNGIDIVVGTIDIGSTDNYVPAWWITYNQWAPRRNENIEYGINDLCVVRLTNAVPNANPVQLLYLPYSELRNKDVITAGWGEANNGTYPRILQTTTLKVLTHMECATRTRILAERHFTVDKNFLCTVGNPFATIIKGDSGGPLLYMNKIVAINSGTCPLPQQSFHPDKVNVHINIFFYKRYLTEMVSV